MPKIATTKIPKSSQKTSLTSYYATGKRKTSIAKLWLFCGDGESFVNGKPLDRYFATEAKLWVVSQPTVSITESLEELPLEVPLAYHFKATILGGGVSAQAQALKHAISKALCLLNPAFRAPLKKSGFLTRDSRIVERKKPGLRSARKRDQYSKR